MVFFNHATRQMTTKIVYYGPGLCGKTTNLNTIYTRTSQKARGEGQKSSASISDWLACASLASRSYSASSRIRR